MRAFNLETKRQNKPSFKTFEDFNGTSIFQDKFFKIIVVCSEGAFKRQQALVKGEVLNIPRIDSSLDGLFSAGLRFIQGKFVFYSYRHFLYRIVLVLDVFLFQSDTLMTATV